MIRINTVDVGPDGLEVNGSEDPAFLELDMAGGFPCEVLDEVQYHLHASMAGRDLLVTGSAGVRIRTQCALCLREITVRIGSDKLCIFREKVPNEIVDLTGRDARSDRGGADVADLRAHPARVAHTGHFGLRLYVYLHLPATSSHITAMKFLATTSMGSVPTTDLRMLFAR